MLSIGCQIGSIIPGWHARALREHTSWSVSGTAVDELSVELSADTAEIAVTASTAVTTRTGNRNVLPRIIVVMFVDRPWRTRQAWPADGKMFAERCGQSVSRLQLDWTGRLFKSTTPRVTAFASHTSTTYSPHCQLLISGRWSSWRRTGRRGWDEVPSTHSTPISTPTLYAQPRRALLEVIHQPALVFPVSSPPNSISSSSSCSRRRDATSHNTHTWLLPIYVCIVVPDQLPLPLPQLTTSRRARSL